MVPDLVQSLGCGAHGVLPARPIVAGHQAGALNQPPVPVVGHQAGALNHQPVNDLDDDDNDNDDSWEECPDDDPIQAESLCLFCMDKLVSPEAIFIHCREKHEFNIYRIHKQYKLDCFSYIKLINFIRKTQPSPEVWRTTVIDGEPPWTSDEFMMPQLEDDGLLQFDIEDLSVECSEEICSDTTTCSDTTSRGEKRCDSSLLVRLKAAQERAIIAEDQLKRVLADLEKMRTIAQEMMLTRVPDLPPSDKSIQNLRGGEDTSYFESYGHFSIHQEMLQDRVRTESYRDAICSNRDLFRDAIVLDVGCGTGILSMFAARAGAKLVIGVEMSDIIYQTMDIVRENGLEDKIKLVRGRMEDVDIPVDKVDIIISEWMGYFLLFESMLDTVLWARDHYLVDGGAILPDKCTICLAALDDMTMHEKHCGFWDDVYGFKMSCMKSAVQKEASVLCVNSDTVVSDTAVIKEIDICTCSTKDLEFTSPFSLTMQREGKVTAIMAYFDTFFTKGSNQVEFSTSPAVPQTHWKQTVFIIDHPVSLKQGEKLDGQLVCKKNYKDPRSLVVHLTIGDRTMKYTMQ